MWPSIIFNNELITADNDSQLFFKDRTYPLIIDEAQYSQNFFRTIKLIVDKSKKKGQIILTGSQSFELMEKVNESLVGRISIIVMSNLSLREIADNKKISYQAVRDSIKSSEKMLEEYEEKIGMYSLKNKLSKICSKDNFDKNEILKLLSEDDI